MKRPLLLVAVLLTLAVADTSATTRLEPPDLSRYLRWGPLRVRPGFELSQLGYDDNILLGTDERKVSDTTATLSPRLDGLLLFGSRAFFTFTERFDYHLYVENEDQNYLDHRGNGRITVPFKRSGVFAGYRLERADLRPIDLEDIRPTRKTRGLDLGAVYRPAWRTEIEIMRTRQNQEHSDPDFSSGGQTISDLLDRLERATTLSVNYALKGRTHAVLELRDADIDFDQPFDDGTGEPIVQDTDELRWRVGVEFRQGGPLTGTFLIGVSDIDARDPARVDFRGWIGEGSLAYRLSSRTRFRLDYERRPGFSVYEDTTYYLNSEVALLGVHYFNRVIGIEAGIRDGTLTFPGSTTRREDDLRRYSAGVRLRMMENSLGRKLEYRFGLRHYNRESTIPGLDRSQTSIGMGAVVGF
ncbi:MAG: outer membrane beta-barrel protein [bacterium]|nr:outer membrane beta-barrel protein [bacterium]